MLKVHQNTSTMYMHAAPLISGFFPTYMYILHIAEVYFFLVVSFILMLQQPLEVLFIVHS